MKIFIGQIYIKPGISFPFSLGFQKWLGDSLSERIEATEPFKKEFGVDARLGIRISAKENIDQPEIKGPTFFKRDKCVEFTIFLPYQSRDYYDPSVAAYLVDQLLQSIGIILQDIKLDPENIVRDAARLRSDFLSISGLLDAK
jgi:hypothetical protein